MAGQSVTIGHAGPCIQGASVAQAGAFGQKTESLKIRLDLVL